MYYYTHLKQDGTYTVLGTSKSKWSYEQIKTFIGNWIEYIPSDYNLDGMKGSLIGDEEGRYKSTNHRNPFTKVLTDPYGGVWDCVGDLLLEQTELQYKKWQRILK